jgi:hypothetical protein
MECLGGEKGESAIATVTVVEDGALEVHEGGTPRLRRQKD